MIDPETTEWLVRGVQGGGLLVVIELVRRMLKPVLAEIRSNNEASNKRHDESMDAHKGLKEEIDNANESINGLNSTCIEIKADIKSIKSDLKRGERRMDKHSTKLDEHGVSIAELKARVD